MLTLLAVACSPGSGLPRDTPQVPAGLSGRLLFTWKDGLATLDLGTAVLAQLAPAPPGARIASARWSPSGSKVAYAVALVEVGAPNTSAVLVASADGSGARTVVSAESARVFYHWPAWDADDAHLYVLRADSTGTRIERIDVASGERRTVLDGAADFDISRDGRLLAFVRNADAGASLNLARLDDSGEMRGRMTAQPFQTVAAPRFAADGGSVLFSLSRPPSLEGSRPDPPPMAGLIGPRGALAHGLPQDIYSVPIEGGPARLVVRLGVDDPVATWSPDGQRAAVLAPDWLGIASPGGSLVPILTPGGYGSVDWAP
jgi:Tol biopolymer transport system component